MMDRYPKIDHEWFGFAFRLMNKAANGQVPIEIRLPATDTPNNMTYAFHVVANEMMWDHDSQTAFEIRAQALIDFLKTIEGEDPDLLPDQPKDILYSAIIQSAANAPLLPSGRFAVRPFLDDVKKYLIDGVIAQAGDTNTAIICSAPQEAISHG